jgi:hypothetical protein
MGKLTFEMRGDKWMVVCKEPSEHMQQECQAQAAMTSNSTITSSSSSSSFDTHRDVIQVGQARLLQPTIPTTHNNNNTPPPPPILTVTWFMLMPR